MIDVTHHCHDWTSLNFFSIQVTKGSHLNQLIIPALEAGKTVICDRFYDSTRAYQGASGVADNELIDRMEKVAVGANRPDKTIILDLPPEVGIERVQSRVAANQVESTQPTEQVTLTIFLLFYVL